MFCYLSTSCFRNEKIKKAIELSGELSNYHVEISAPHPYETTQTLKNIFQLYVKEGYSFTFHNYFPTPKNSFVLNIASKEKKTRDSCDKMFSSVLELSPYANSKIYGIHAGYLSKVEAKSDGNFKFENTPINYKESLIKATTYVTDLQKEFEKKKVNLLIENLFPSISRKSSLFCSLEDINDFVKLIPMNTGLLLDLGHLNISSNILNFDRFKFLEEYLSLYSHRLCEVHVSENNGFKDEHLALKNDSWQLDAIKLIEKSKPPMTGKRIYCLEARNSTKKELKTSLGMINELIS